MDVGDKLDVMVDVGSCVVVSCAPTVAEEGRNVCEPVNSDGKLLLEASCRGCKAVRSCSEAAWLPANARAAQIKTFIEPMSTNFR